MPDVYSTYEAKSHFSEIIRKVRSGKRVVIAYRGEQIAEIRPLAVTPVDRERVDFQPGLLDGIAWVSPQRPLSAEFDRILRIGVLRGADLWHVACALFLEPGPRSLAFLTLDRRQKEIAAALGFETP